MPFRDTRFSLNRAKLAALIECADFLHGNVPGFVHMSEVAPASADATDGRADIISFAIGGDQYGVDIMSVREIKEWSKVTKLPEQPEYVSGVLNLRGVMVPVIDRRCRFGAGLTECSPTHIVIVVQINGRQVGLLADRVLDIVSFDTAKVQPVPRTAQSTAKFLSGLVTHDDTMIALIDLRHLLEHEGEVASGGLAA
jgi:purine-binding chemotaxis protein CheW